jgi:hypothetical protein
MRRRSIRSSVVAGVLITAAVTLAPASASRAAPARTVTVCPTGPPICDFASIAAALAAVSDGDEILVAPGGYAGGFTVDKSVSLVGSGQSSTNIDGSGASKFAAVMSISLGATVEMRGFTIAKAVSTGVVNAGTLLRRRRREG